MNPPDLTANLASVSLPDAENELSRRYLHLITRWVPVALRYFNDWPDRPDCGHFFGGVLWYGQETSMTIQTLALAASSPEFDPALAGISADELRRVVLKGLRYLCFTHDTGPADCVRPKESWGRTEPAGKKWGERGRGFFPESQCGVTIANLALAAACVRDLIGDEEREMLARIAADYLERFGTMEPRSGVYFDTQMEENGWTTLGLVASLVLLPNHPAREQIWENARLWMFRTATMPADAHDRSPFADGKTVRQLCNYDFTTLPDCTAENHGFVHPSYMASGVWLASDTRNLLRLFNWPEPPHLLWHRRDIYNALKPAFDSTGAAHCAQGMDWPYFYYPAHANLHAAAALLLDDPDAALLEQRTLDTLERSAAAHAGRIIPETTARYCHSQQDPALMHERLAVCLSAACLAHRLFGPGPVPADPDDFERRARGVHVFPHGGLLLHRHERGINSLAWRNGSMVLPATREGMRLIGPARGSFLANVQVRGKAESACQVVFRLRESTDRAAALLVEDLAQRTVRRQLFFASLPSGKCLTAERLIALERATVEQVEQGRLTVINDDYFGEQPRTRPVRRLFWQGAERSFEGYPIDSDRDDLTADLTGATWLNVDDRLGLVFRATGRTLYHNRHHWKTWHATEDDLVLNTVEGPRDLQPGETIAELIALSCPEQTHADTAAEPLRILSNSAGTSGADLFAAEIDGLLCACNFASAPARLPSGRILDPLEPVLLPLA